MRRFAAIEAWRAPPQTHDSTPPLRATQLSGQTKGICDLRFSVLDLRFFAAARCPLRRADPLGNRPAPARQGGPSGWPLQRIIVAHAWL
jgi:hypothetical protein